MFGFELNQCIDLMLALVDIYSHVHIGEEEIPHFPNLGSLVVELGQFRNMKMFKDGITAMQDI